MYLLDTSVISELRKGERSNPGVRRFLFGVDPDALFVPVQTIGELRKGVETIRLRRDVEQAQRLARWLDGVVEDYGDRILDFDQECAQLWGRLVAMHPQHPIDKQIAAIALLYDFIVVTRNTADFDGTGARILNPFVDA